MKRKDGKKEVERRTNVNRGEGVRKRREGAWNGRELQEKGGGGSPEKEEMEEGRKVDGCGETREMKSGDGKFKRGERDVGRVLKEI